MSDDLRKPASLLHDGEIEAQRRFDPAGRWTETSLRGMFLDHIPVHFARFAESLPFFFIATSDTAGECDCSFRGLEYSAAGKPYPLVKVINPTTLVFPDYSGNKLFNSLGNILVNPNIGMLFIDFQNRIRMRINGRATIVEGRSAHADVWPLAERYVTVTPTQVFPNCRARIPEMKMADPLAGHFMED